MISVSRLLLLFICITSVHAVSIEYYDTADTVAEPEYQDTNKTKLQERSNITEKSINNESAFYDGMEQSHTYTEGYKNEDIEIYAENDKSFGKFNNLKTVARSAGNDDASNVLGFSESVIPDDYDNIPSYINTEGDNEYAYNSKFQNTTLPKLLRSEITESQISSNYTKLLSSGNTSEDESSPFKNLVDFYNLQPAVDVDHDDSYTIRAFKNNTIWYVPERHACWNLPVLYGELGWKMNTDVFRIYLGKLKNVIDTEEEVILQPRKYSMKIPEEQILNKWCEAAPCYGDHTLCLFPEKINSKLCLNDFEVLTPSRLDQVGLVNTVNSMRNHVAKGDTEIYHHLPTAANMKQVIYDYDLERMALAWLHQCLPGPAPCSALDKNSVAQLECMKYANYCCINSFKNNKATCIPRYECFINPIIGCIHAWFWSAGRKLTSTDVACGHLTEATFNTVQLIWADTNKIGCAYGQKPNGDVRVVCNFAPGAPFYIETKYYCGLIAHKDIANFQQDENITDSKYLTSMGIKIVPLKSSVISENEFTSHHVNHSLKFSYIDVLSKIYKSKWVRQKLSIHRNGTIAMLARVVTRYSFTEDRGSRCDLDEPIYKNGSPGSLCVERGRRFQALCYDFRDPTPGYRLVAVLAPVALFSLILYDLFSGVVRQTDY